MTNRPSLPNSDVKVIAGTAVAITGIVVAGVCAVLMPDGRIEHFGRWLTDPATAFTLAGLITAVGGAIYRAKHQQAPGGGAALLLALVLGAATTLSGCTAAQTQQATTVGRQVLAWTCPPAKKICEMFASSTEFGAEACAAIDTVCDIGGAVLNSTVPDAVSEPHDLDVDEEAP